ncbi:MAG: acylneuraminate cytidylyltransferase family protein [Kiritimatiellae bacterium]|nr:acylneuraminate cytidylyltransferase family protein [Kiritimatiellia bacterium]
MEEEVLAIIPARGGSKGIPRKNIRMIAGKPLIAWTIQAALVAKAVSRVIVSTDDDEIANVACTWGAEVIKRPEVISGDSATSEAALSHVLERLCEQEGYEPDIVVFLQCTSPVRRRSDVDDAVAMLKKSQADSLLSVVPILKFFWKKSEGKAVSLNYDYRARPRHQELSPLYHENGSIYVFKPRVLRQFQNRLGGRIVLYEMPPDSAVDIDAEDDFIEAEKIMQRLCAGDHHE